MMHDEIVTTYKGCQILRNGFGEYETRGLGDGDGCGFSSIVAAKRWISQVKR